MQVGSASRKWLHDAGWPAGAVTAAATVCLSCALGLIALLRPLANLWNLWTTDPLRSVGMLFPFVSALLIILQVRRMQWRVRGSWWGLPVLALAVVGGHLRETMMVVFEYQAGMSQTLPTDSMVIFTYGCGAVLFFGGMPLLRRSLIPLALLLCLNPVPHDFNHFVDVPLQYASAHIARSFAIFLGARLTPDQLRLMFTPEFGIYIAPGCNGIRGAVTMGYIALITGYACRFRWWRTVLLSLGAVALGYLFNFLRLCLLVVFYVIAMHHPSLQSHGRNVDYGIGSCLFLLAVILLAAVVVRADRSRPTGPTIESADDVPQLSFGPLWPRLALLAVLAGLGSLAYAHPLLNRSMTPRRAHIDLDALYPRQVGGFTRLRVWKETWDMSTLEAYDWAEYRQDTNGGLVDIGISPVLGAHDAVLCHLMRDEHPNWRGPLLMQVGDGPVVFDAFQNNDGVTQYVEMSTLCGPDNCGEASASVARFRIYFSHPLAGSLTDEANGRPVPVVMRAETDAATPADDARVRLLALEREFAASLQLKSLARQYFER